jgi:hypothetical protein
MPSSEKDAASPNGVADGRGASPPDPSSQGAPGEPVPWLLRFGGVVGAGTLGAAIASAPATLRVASVAGVCSPAGTWALLGGVAIVPMSISIVALRRARVGFGALGQQESVALATTTLLWLASSFASVTLLGSFLRARTHHRALGGVVLAGCTLAVAAALALVCSRAAKIVLGLAQAARRAALVMGGAFLGLLLIALSSAALLSVARAPSPRTEDAKLLDAMAFALSALLASASPIVHRRVLALVGPPLAVAILVLGVSSLFACPVLGDAVEEKAPLFFWLVSLVAPH